MLTDFLITCHPIVAQMEPECGDEYGLSVSIPQVFGGVRILLQNLVFYYLQNIFSYTTCIKQYYTNWIKKKLTTVLVSKKFLFQNGRKKKVKHWVFKSFQIWNNYRFVKCWKK
jgi:hypothetical protein